jgi:hypothetical protein
MSSQPKTATVHCTMNEIVIGNRYQLRHYKDSEGHSWLRLEDLTRPDSGVSLTTSGVSDLVEGLVRLEAGMT